MGKNVLEELKSAIGKKMLPTATTAPPVVQDSAQPPTRKTAPRQRRQVTAKPAPPPEAPRRSGRGVQFYLEDSDRKTIHRLAVWFGSQDRRVSDSQVVKTALRLADANQGAKLLEFCDEVRAADPRRQKRTGSRTGKK